MIIIVDEVELHRGLEYLLQCSNAIPKVQTRPKNMSMKDLFGIARTKSKGTKK